MVAFPIRWFDFSVIPVRWFDFSVIPAKARIYTLRWTPVFAEMTVPYLNHLKRNTAAPHFPRTSPLPTL